MAPTSNSKSTPNDYKSKGKQPTKFKKNLRLSREEQAAVDEFHAFYDELSKADKEKKNDERSPYQPADHNTPKAKMENPLPPGAKGLAASRWAVKKEEDIKSLPIQKAASHHTEEDRKPLLSNSTKGLAHSRFAKKAEYFPVSPTEQAAVDEFHAFYAELAKSDERKADEKSVYQPADHNTPRAKMENPLPPGAKGLASSRWAKKEEEDPKPQLLKATQGLANSRFSKKPSGKGNGKTTHTKRFGSTPEEDAAVKAFFAESPEDREQKADEKSVYQPADHNTPRAKMENPLPPGAKGLASSRWARKEDTIFVPQN